MRAFIMQGVIVKRTGNPRNANGARRRAYRKRFAAMGAPCGICRGRLGPIRYDEPSDSAHPLSFAIDEIKPVSRWKQFGYDSARAAAEDWDNLQAAHYYCNALKSNKLVCEMNAMRLHGKLDAKAKTLTHEELVQDGTW